MNLAIVQQWLDEATALGGEVDTMTVSRADAEYHNLGEVQTFAERNGLTLKVSEYCPVGRVYLHDSQMDTTPPQREKAT